MLGVDQIEWSKSPPPWPRTVTPVRTPFSSRRPSPQILSDAPVLVPEEYGLSLAACDFLKWLLAKARAAPASPLPLPPTRPSPTHAMPTPSSGGICFPPGGRWPAVDQGHRLQSASEVKRHPWLWDVDWDAHPRPGPEGGGGTPRPLAP